MILAFDARGIRHRTGWQLSPQVPFSFQIAGHWWLRICIRDAHTKKGICETSFTKIQVLAPTGMIQGPSLICGKSSGIYSVSNHQVNETYQWDFGNSALPSTASGPGPHTVEFIREGPNTILLSTKILDLCTSTNSLQTYVEWPEVFIGNDRAECLHDTIQFCVVSPRTTGTYLWSTGDITTCTKKYIQSSINQFSINYTTEKGCLASDTIKIVSDSCAKVGNYVWLDEGSTTVSANGIQDNNENGVPNIFVELKNKFNNTIKSTTTNQNGYYEFCTFSGEYYI